MPKTKLQKDIEKELKPDGPLYHYTVGLVKRWTVGWFDWTNSAEINKSLNADLHSIDLPVDNIKGKFTHQLQRTRANWSDSDDAKALIKALGDDQNYEEVVKNAEEDANTISLARGKKIDDFCQFIAKECKTSGNPPEVLLAVYDQIQFFDAGEDEYISQATEQFEENLISKMMPDDKNLSEDEKNAKQKEIKLKVKDVVDAFRKEKEAEKAENQKAYQNLIETMHHLMDARYFHASLIQSMNPHKRKALIAQKQRQNVSIDVVDSYRDITLDEALQAQAVGKFSIHPDGSIHASLDTNPEQVLKKLAQYEAAKLLENPDKPLAHRTFTQSNVTDPKQAKKIAEGHAITYMRELLKAGVPLDKMPNCTISIQPQGQEYEFNFQQHLQAGTTKSQGLLVRPITWLYGKCISGDMGNLSSAYDMGKGRLGFDAKKSAANVLQDKAHINSARRDEYNKALGGLRLDQGNESVANVTGQNFLGQKKKFQGIQASTNGKTNDADNKSVSTVTPSSSMKT